MTVQISWLLQQRQLALTLRAGPSSAVNPIQFAQSTELQDPRPWLSGGELVLTTGLNFPLDDASLNEYVERLSSVGVAALGFGTGLSHESVPAPLLEAADRVGLPLLEVPLRTPFAAVTKAVMARIAEQEYELVLEAAEVQTRITRAALRGGVSAIVRELAIATKTSVAFLGERTVSVHPLTETSLIKEARTALTKDGNTMVAGSISVSAPGRTLTLQQVGLSESGHGYLAMAGPGPLANVDRVLLGHAVSLLTLELEKPVRLRAEQARLNGIALGLLLDGRIAPNSVPAYLHDASDTTGQIRILVIRTNAADAVRQHLDTAFSKTNRALYAQVTDADITVLLRGDDSAEGAKEWLSQLPPAVTKVLRSGVSKAHPMTETGRALEQARMAANLANAEAKLLEFDAFGGPTVLASDQAREALIAIASSTIPVLSSHDEAHGSALVPSLRAYLESNGQWESAAAVLGVHRHTLRGRITRVEELLSCDLSQARVRAELLLALLAWEGR